ncbi:hypothetical protein AMAG_00743 [Allomyces macrogynus ATCC 38327]|uniref:Uncharacterized protein n=1 Tax=Allomyces macrogynus (strain ATCC 38327) TaxID=578462 RepID=A0A0L0RXC9_ALLM3|nr:hypothetical protein AMAG_00743 [Allomyces macrogynus ATCC 38327]|eukprot:KNE54789.1 hypothetical protein AMAG_00743 [Allomyces macrogynus ATCC 38327]
MDALVSVDPVNVDAGRIAACTSWSDWTVPWRADGNGFSECFVDIWLSAMIPLGWTLILIAAAFWCNRKSRASYTLLGQSPTESEIAGAVTGVQFAISRVTLHVLRVFTDILWAVLSGELQTGSVAAGVLRSVAHSLLAAIAVHVVLHPRQRQFRGYFPWTDVLATALVVDALCQAATFSTMHTGLAALPDFCSLIVLALTVTLLFFSGADYLARSATPTSESRDSHENTASLWSLSTFSWFNEIIDKGVVKSLELDDLWQLYPNDTSAVANDVYLSVLPQSRNLIHGLWLAVRHHLILQVAMGVTGASLAFTGPLVLNKLLQFTQDRDPNTLLGVVYVIFLFLGTVTRSILDSQTYFRGRRVGTRVRAILIGQVYAKALKAKNKNQNVGQIMNLMQIDANKILELSAYLHYFFSTPLQIIICIVALYRVLGWASFAGVAVMLAVIPLNAATAKRAAKLQKDLMESTDKRISLVSEIFAGIRTIKYFAGEPKGMTGMTSVRAGELVDLRGDLVFAAGLSGLGYLVPLLCTMSTFASFAVLMGQPLTATKVFTAISLFMTLKNPLAIFPDMIIRLLEVMVSFDRINAYLAEETVTHPPIGAQITVTDDAEFRWGAAGSAFRLHRLNATIPVGKLTLVLGKTSAGKSSFLHALLGEMTQLQGHLTTPPVVAYAAQQAWLQNATIRDNVLFGSPFQKNRYDKVLQACALVRDLEILPAGDMTEVGDKGVNLSGGQKSRLGLSRAAYSANETVLMDDVLSALDAPTGKHVFEEAVLKLMRGKTRVLVTHAVSLTLPHADYVIVLDHGEIKAQGTPAEIGKLGILQDLKAEEDQFQAETEPETVEAMIDADESSSPTDLLPPGLRARKISHLSATSQVEDSSPAPDKPDLAAIGRLVQDEERCRGSVSWHIYRAWITAAGGMSFWVPLVAFLALQQVLLVGQDLWLRHWSNAYLTGDEVNAVYYLGIYVALGFIAIGLITGRLIYQFHGSLRASKSMHDELLFTLLHAKLLFWDRTPLGRVINRMSRDMQTVDRDIARDLVDGMVSGFQFLSILLLIIGVAPILLVVLVPVVFWYRAVAQRFLSTSRELKRLDSLTRSPIYSQFSETLTGVTTIRSFGHESRFMQELHRRVDLNHGAFFYLWISNRWLNVRTDWISAIVVFLTGLVLVLSRDMMDPALIGVTISYALTATDAIMWFIRIQAMVEMDLNSIERCVEWIDGIDKEPAEDTPTQIKPPATWPAFGIVEVRDLVAQYSPEAGPVLRGISFEVPARSRIAICGRSGAGKSSLAAALFRFIEWTRGTIMIDGVDLRHLDLHTLRSRVTLVPQDPVLFTGSVRSNLDVFGEYSDPEIQEALERVHLAHIPMEAPVAENGGNFSVGTRQLLSLARALLRRSRVLLLDECTASVDRATDNLIQATLREAFANCTILTIAHKLSTIIDSDRVLVLSAGEVVEYDTPYNLMTRDGSYFQHMCRESGEFDSLLAAATK